MISSDWRSQVFEKKNCGLNQAQNEVFGHFFEFGLLVFLEIAYNDSLQQCITSSRNKTHEKKFGGPNFGQTSQNRVGK